MALDTAVSAMSAGEIVLLVFACCVGALMMGAVGMGGVVILPALLVAGIDVGPAIVSIYLAVMPASLMKLLEDTFSKLRADLAAEKSARERNEEALLNILENSVSASHAE